MKKNRKRTDALMIMLTADEKEKISQVAYDKGMTMSAYARMVLLESANNLRKEDA